jgi:hypothetical protein
MSLKKDMEKTYGPEKAEQVAFAVSTQQAHRLGKSPKTFKSKVTGKKERFGTPEARTEAKAKFDKPKKEYQKTASFNLESFSDELLEIMGHPPLLKSAGVFQAAGKRILRAVENEKELRRLSKALKVHEAKAARMRGRVLPKKKPDTFSSLMGPAFVKA